MAIRESLAEIKNIHGKKDRVGEIIWFEEIDNFRDKKWSEFETKIEKQYKDFDY